MMKMFLLTEDEKIAFLKVVYTVMMFDRQINDYEYEILKILQKDIFQVENFEKIDLEYEDHIVEEINKIKKLIPVIYLFNILFELQIYVKDKKIFLEKVNNILEKVKFYDDIIKSKLFVYSKSYELNKSEKNEDIVEKGMKIEEIVEKGIKVFDKIFKK